LVTLANRGGDVKRLAGWVSFVPAHAGRVVESVSRGLFLNWNIECRGMKVKFSPNVSTVIKFATWSVAIIGLLGTAFAQNQTAKPETETLTQETNIGGTRYVVHFVKEKLEWHDELRGYLLTLRVREEERAFTSLTVPDEAKPTPLMSSTNRFPTKIVTSKDQLTPIDLHTDIRVTAVWEPATTADQQILQYYGKVSMCMIPSFNTPDNQSKIIPLAGTSGTRIDLSLLFDQKDRLRYLGRYWRPKNGKEAILVITKNAIEALNVEAVDIK
jgi:hypothetical protein